MRPLFLHRDSLPKPYLVGRVRETTETGFALKIRVGSVGRAKTLILIRPISGSNQRFSIVYAEPLRMPKGIYQQ